MSIQPGGNGGACESGAVDTCPLQAGLKVPESVYPVPLLRAEKFGIRVCSGDPNKQTQSLTSATLAPDPPKLSIPSAFGKYKLAHI